MPENRPDHKVKNGIKNEDAWMIRLVVDDNQAFNYKALSALWSKIIDQFRTFFTLFLP